MNSLELVQLGLLNADAEVFRESAVANARAGYPRNETLREMAVELIATFEPSSQHQPVSAPYHFTPGEVTGRVGVVTKIVNLII